MTRILSFDYQCPECHQYSDVEFEAGQIGNWWTHTITPSIHPDRCPQCWADWQITDVRLWLQEIAKGNAHELEWYGEGLLARKGKLVHKDVKGDGGYQTTEDDE